jgi:hypothetical protein
VRRWRAGKKLPQLNPPAAGGRHKRHRPPTGTTFGFTVDQSATVTFIFSRLVAGRREHGRCVRARGHVKRRLRCTRTVTAGTLRLTAPAGSDSVAFQGPITRKSRLSPGRYMVTIAASGAAGQRSATKTLSFTILR